MGPDLPTMQQKLRVIAVEALNPAGYISVQGHSWHPHGSNISEVDPLWIAIGFQPEKLNVRLAVPITSFEGSSLVLELLNANGNPVDFTTKEDPIRAWSVPQAVPETE